METSRVKRGSYTL